MKIDLNLQNLLSGFDLYEKILDLGPLLKCHTTNSGKKGCQDVQIPQQFRPCLSM